MHLKSWQTLTLADSVNVIMNSCRHLWAETMRAPWYLLKMAWMLSFLSICEHLPEQIDKFLVLFCGALATFIGVFGFNVRTLNGSRRHSRPLLLLTLSIPKTQWEALSFHTYHLEFNRIEPNRSIRFVAFLELFSCNLPRPLSKMLISRIAYMINNNAIDLISCFSVRLFWFPLFSSKRFIIIDIIISIVGIASKSRSTITTITATNNRIAYL